MVSSFVIAEGKQRTPEGYGEFSKGRRKDTGVVSGCRRLFWISHNLRRKPLLWQAAEEGRVVSPISCGLWRYVPKGRMCYIRGGHRALLPVGCFGKCRGRKE